MPILGIKANDGLPPNLDLRLANDELIHGGSLVYDIVQNPQPTICLYPHTTGTEKWWLDLYQHLLKAFPDANIIEILPKANGCVGEISTFKITVDPTPNVAISPSSEDICTGETTNINLSGSVATTTFNWTVTDITPSGSVAGASNGEGDKIQQTLINDTNKKKLDLKHLFTLMSTVLQGLLQFIIQTLISLMIL